MRARAVGGAHDRLGVALRLISLVSLALALFVGAAHAQPLALPNNTPEQCSIQAGETLSKLEARQKALERDISASTGAGKKVCPRLSKAAAQKAQEDLLEIVFRIDCLKRAAAGQVVTRRGYGPDKSKADDIVEVALYFATDRQPTSSTDPAGMYASESDSKLHYGQAVVSIPLTHTVGNIELPSLWKLERNADPKKHFVLKSVAQLPTEAALKAMAEQVNSIASKTLLVFVHGYYTSFADAALRTAQLSHDLKFQGLTLFYSWPSAGLLRGYWQDEEAARLSERTFEQMLDDLAKLPFSDIYVVAHSMGTGSWAMRCRAGRRRASRCTNCASCCLPPPTST